MPSGRIFSTKGRAYSKALWQERPWLIDQKSEGAEVQIPKLESQAGSGYTRPGNYRRSLGFILSVMGIH
jgi:hypothetical protein